MNPHHVPRFIGVMLIFSSLIIFLSPSILAQQEEDELYGPGNRWMYRAKVKDKNDAQLGRWAWDVFLVSGY